MREILAELRFARRSLAKTPAVTLVVVLTLALGIGANTAIFSVVDAVLLTPLPYPQPDRLVVLIDTNPEAGFPRFSTSPPGLARGEHLFRAHDRDDAVLLEPHGHRR